jgi:hypothetical protein
VSARPAQESHLPCREAAAEAAVQTQEAPAAATLDERDPELVAQRQRLQDVPEARAPVQLSIRLAIERADDHAGPH